MTRARCALRIFPVLLLALGGCASIGSAGRSGDYVSIRIANSSWSESSVYIVRDNLRQRIATLRPLSEGVAHVAFSRFHGGDVQFAVRLLGEPEEFRSTRVHVRPGMSVDLSITNALTLTQLVVR